MRRVKSTLSSLSNYVESMLDDEYEGYRPIVRKIENPAACAVREKTVLEEEQLKKLLDHLVDKKHYDKACMLAMCMSNGRRKAELPRMKVSYFTEDNILDGHLPLEKYLPVGEQENDVYPINITYDVAIKMKSWTGDYINLKVVDGENDEYINLYITGILKPDGMEDEKHLSVALLSHNAYEKVLCRTEFAKYASFYSSCDMQNCEETFLCEHLKDMKKSVLKKTVTYLSERFFSIWHFLVLVMKSVLCLKKHF